MSPIIPPRLLSLLAALTILFATARSASAGCPSSSQDGCQMAAGATAQAGPWSDCLQIDFEENDCVCSSTMIITNQCASPLEARGFDWCEREYDDVCPSEIAPGEVGRLHLPREGATALGEHAVDLPVRVGQEEADMVVRYEMIHVEGGGCSASGTSSAAAALLLLALFVALRRRTRAA